LYYLGLHACIDPEYTAAGGSGPVTISKRPDEILKTKDIEKTVMFGGDISKIADRSSTKRDSLRYKLSTEEKINLYKFRPDLDTRSEMREPLVKKRRKKKTSVSAADADNKVGGGVGGNGETSDSSINSSVDEGANASGATQLLQDRISNMESGRMPSPPVRSPSPQVRTQSPQVRTQSPSKSPLLEQQQQSVPQWQQDQEQKYDGSEVVSAIHDSSSGYSLTVPSSSSSSAAAHYDSAGAVDVESGGAPITSPSTAFDIGYSVAPDDQGDYYYDHHDHDGASVSSEGSSTSGRSEDDSSDDEDDEEDMELKSPFKRGEQS
jgi:hypothetical protein